MKTLFALIPLLSCIFLFCGLAVANPVTGSSMPIENTDMHSLDEISKPWSQIEDEETPIEKSDVHSLQDLSETLSAVESEENFEDQDGTQPEVFENE